MLKEGNLSLLLHTMVDDYQGCVEGFSSSDQMWKSVARSSCRMSTWRTIFRILNDIFFQQMGMRALDHYLGVLDTWDLTT